MTEIDATFARRMREAREARGLSQTALARELQEYGIHIDGTAITRIEKNASNDPSGRTIRLSEAVAIAKVLMIPLQNLLKQEPALIDQLQDTRMRLAKVETELAVAIEQRSELQAIAYQIEEALDASKALEAADVALLRARQEYERLRALEAQVPPSQIDQHRQLVAEAAAVNEKCEVAVQAAFERFEHAKSIVRKY